MTNSVRDTASSIRTFVMQELAPRRGVAQVADDESLVELGIVDSLGLFQLMAFLEETFSITVADDELIPDNFRTLATIDRFVRGKREETA